MPKRAPAELWPPAWFVRKEMAARGWTVADLAAASNYGEKFFDPIFEGWRLSAWDCRTLASVFGTSWQFWRKLDDSFWEALESGEYHLAKN